MTDRERTQTRPDAHDQVPARETNVPVTPEPGIARRIIGARSGAPDADWLVLLECRHAIPVNGLIGAGIMLCPNCHAGPPAQTVDPAYWMAFSREDGEDGYVIVMSKPDAVCSVCGEVFAPEILAPGWQPDEGTIDGLYRDTHGLLRHDCPSFYDAFDPSSVV